MKHKKKLDSYTGNKIVQESGTGSEDITDIRMIDNGNAYTSLPTLTITSSGGSSATVNKHEHEWVEFYSLKTIEAGFNYDASPSPPTLTVAYENVSHRINWWYWDLKCTGSSNWI